jgi:phage shock protein PspC (stress-responsive transcriptional regulator)
MQEDRIVEKWLRRDTTRWFAGVLAGLFAGSVAMIFAMYIASSASLESWLPVKLFATLLFGNKATEYGMNTTYVFAGAAVLSVIFAIWGTIFAHFVYTNHMPSLLAMGMVWGVFLWIFNWNLYLQSFLEIRSAGISAGAAFPVCLAYGVSLVSVAFFDRVLRGGK